ncbi:hypothetical protein AHAS_Ahas15G0260800 [Arachis hypogaea]
MDETRDNFQNQGASIRNLKIQIGQNAKQLIERPSNNFPSNTIPNPREECKGINLRSGRVVSNENKSQTKASKEAHVEEEKQEKEGTVHAPTTEAPKKKKTWFLIYQKFFILKDLRGRTKRRNISNSWRCLRSYHQHSIHRSFGTNASLC